ncbi:MAG: DUF4910 domain-containing protein [Planctomycetota bacterium]
MTVTQTSISTLMEQLYPLHRSQTGEGVRNTLEMLKKFGLEMEVFEIPSGTKVFDWEVPQEWKFQEAYIETESGVRIVDSQESNLHILNGSKPFRGRISFDELKSHLYRSDRLPNSVPYRTAFFQDEWGFCVNQSQYCELENCNGPLNVVVDTEMFDGSMTYGEAILLGESSETVVIWAHTCHPSLANDNVSGIATAAELYQKLSVGPRKFTYRFVFAPATIGAITWLFQNRSELDKIKFGMVLTLLGDDQSFTFKLSRQHDHLIDRCLLSMANTANNQFKLEPFSPMGYDERQFCSPGINLPFVRISRSTPETFAQYHTSDDCLSIISEFRILEAADMVYSVLQIAETNCLPVNISPHCEPHLGSRGLYASYGNQETANASQRSILWTLNLSDGQHDALTISDRSKIPYLEILQAIHVLSDHGLLEIEKANND